MRLLILILLLLGWLCFFASDSTATAADWSRGACAGGVCVGPVLVAVGPAFRQVVHRGQPGDQVQAVAWDRSRPFLQRGPARRLVRGGVILTGRLVAAPFGCGR